MPLMIFLKTLNNSSMPTKKSSRFISSVKVDFLGTTTLTISLFYSRKNKTAQKTYNYSVTYTSKSQRHQIRHNGGPYEDWSTAIDRAWNIILKLSLKDIK